MARKAKKAKKAKKASKSRKAGSATTTRKTPVTVPMQSVVQFVKALIDQGRDVEFENRAKRSNALVILDDDGAAFVTKFLAGKKTLRVGMRAAIRKPCPGNPFKC